MSKFINVIDSSSFYLRPEIVSDNTTLTNTMIETPCPSGFYKPRWDGTAWVEGLTQAEIDAIPNTPVVSLEELATSVNDAYVAIMELSLQ